MLLPFGNDAHEIVVFDPASVRSAHAAFDPALTGENDLTAAIRHGGETPRRDDFVTPELPGWESNTTGDLAYWDGKPIRMKWGFHDVGGNVRHGAGLLHLIANGRDKPSRSAPDVANGDEAENVARMLVKLLPMVTQKFAQFARRGEKFGLSSPRMPGGVIVEDMGDYWGVVSMATPAMKANWGDGETTSRPVAWSSGFGERPAWEASSPVPKTAQAFTDRGSADAPSLQSKGQRVSLNKIDTALNFTKNEAEISHRETARCTVLVGRHNLHGSMLKNTRISLGTRRTKHQILTERGEASASLMLAFGIQMKPHSQNNALEAQKFAWR